MPKPDVMVTVEGGVARVDVLTSGLLVEVRDFDVECADEDDEFLWINEQGDLCWRYFAGDVTEQKAVAVQDRDCLPPLIACPAQ